MNKNDKNQFSEIEKDILKYLLGQQQLMICSYQIFYNEKLKRKYSGEEIVKAGNNLRSMGLITFDGQDGHILDSDSLKQLKKLFHIKYFIYRMKIFLNHKLFKILSGIWNNFIIKILVPIAVAYLIIKFGLNK